jgi:2-methylcitrate dehydratase PrpD
MDGNVIVSHFVGCITWQDLPPAVQRLAHLALLDTLGAALTGTQAPVSTITAHYAAETWPGDGATILLQDQRASALGAAFANGYAANAFDIDDCALYTKGHPGAQIMPAALALSESLAASGTEMLVAMVVGYEVAHRTARIWHATRDVYQACGSWGSVACAAVAARLLRLSPEQTRHALGIADYHAPNLPMMRDIDDPAMVKHGIGWGAMTGITAAQLAAKGFTGVPSLLGSEAYADSVSDIGQRYIMDGGLTWKGYACCAWDHAAMKAAARLVVDHAIDVEQIAHLCVEAPHETVRLGTELPATTEEAQFNLAWPLAGLLIDGEVGPAQIREQRLGDKRIRSLAEKVELVEAEDLSELYRLASQGDPRGKYAARVTITLRDGTSVKSGAVEGNINYPQQGWDEERLERKFRWLTGQVLGEGQIDALLEMVRNFDQVDDVRQFTPLLAPSGS